MKKRIANILTCICLVLCMMPKVLNAQNNKPLNMPLYDNEPFHFGLIVGYNQMWLSPQFVAGFQSIKYEGEYGKQYFQNINKDECQYIINDISLPLPFGLSIGWVSNFRLAKYFDFRFIPTFSYCDSDIKYKYTVYSAEGEKVHEQDFSRYQLNLEFPLQFKYRSKRYNNTAAYVIFGANNKINLTAKKFDIKLRRYDFAPEIGTGFDFYTGEFKVGIEIKMSYGLRNMIDSTNPTPLTSSFDKLKNKTFQLSFTFE